LQLIDISVSVAVILNKFTKTRRLIQSHIFHFTVTKQTAVYHLTHVFSCVGGAENDGHENDGPSKCPVIKLTDMKMTDMKMQDTFQVSE